MRNRRSAISFHYEVKIEKRVEDNFQKDPTFDPTEVINISSDEEIDSEESDISENDSEDDDEYSDDPVIGLDEQSDVDSSDADDESDEPPAKRHCSKKPAGFFKSSPDDGYVKWGRKKKTNKSKK